MVGLGVRLLDLALKSFENRTSISKGKNKEFHLRCVEEN